MANTRCLHKKMKRRNGADMPTLIRTGSRHGLSPDHVWQCLSSLRRRKVLIVDESVAPVRYKLRNNRTIKK